MVRVGADLAVKARNSASNSSSDLALGAAGAGAGAVVALGAAGAGAVVALGVVGAGALVALGAAGFGVAALGAAVVVLVGKPIFLARVLAFLLALSDIFASCSVTWF